MRTTFFVASVAILACGALASPFSVTTTYPTTTASGSFAFGSSVSGSPSFGSGTHTPRPTTVWTHPPPSASGTLYTSYVVHLSDTTYTTIVPGATPGTTHTDFGTPSISVPLPSITVPPAYSQGTTTTPSASEALYTSYVVHLSDTTYTTIVPGATPGTTHTDLGTPSNSIKFPSTTVPPAYSQGTTTTGTYSTSPPTMGAQQLGSIKSNGALGIGMGAGAVFTAVVVAASTFVSL